VNKTYNGWTNYETWNVNLWIDNDQGEQEYWQERAADCLENTKDDDDPRGNAIAALSNEMEYVFDDLYDEQKPKSGPLADILRAALSEVNWHEIARHYIDAVLEEVSDAESNA
jgi:hypothetical protein